MSRVRVQGDLFHGQPPEGSTYIFPRELHQAGENAAELESLVHAETRDAELEQIAARLDERSAAEDPTWNGRNLLQRLLAVRTQARRRVRDRLALAAALANGDRQERDELLRRIAGWDDPADSGRSLVHLNAPGLQGHDPAARLLARLANDWPGWPTDSSSSTRRPSGHRSTHGASANFGWLSAVWVGQAGQHGTASRPAGRPGVIWP
jgi:hypothetical protein